MEVGCSSSVGRSVLPMFTELGMKGRSLKQAVKNMANTAATEWLWVRREVRDCDTRLVCVVD